MSKDNYHRKRKKLELIRKSQPPMQLQKKNLMTMLRGQNERLGLSVKLKGEKHQCDRKKELLF